MAVLKAAGWAQCLEQLTAPQLALSTIQPMAQLRANAMAGRTAQPRDQHWAHATADSKAQHSAWRMDAAWGELREREKA